MSNLARIADNVAQVRQRIADAACASGRKPEDVRLVAVTKYVGLEEIRATVAAGCHALGESRPQQLWERAEALRNLPIAWHLIGTLQRNKVRRSLPLVAMIHSADSDALVAAIDRIAGELQLRVPLLLEVNVSGEASKHGLAPEAVEPLLPELAQYQHVE
ncbi:MAG: YggS family pyridoxal phosphate-dependent enzyme, partial [Thermoguttaceae bacterium]